MEIEHIRKDVHHEPFEPFVLRLSDGRAKPVKHPDFIAMTQDLVVVVDPDGTVSSIDPFLIVSLDKKPQRSKRQ